MSIKMKTGLWLSGLFAFIAFGVWIYQLKEGLILTNMQNGYSWGLYISGLAFFVGNAAGGLVLTSSIYLFGVKKLKPLAKLGALTAFANVTAAMFIVIPDIGKPQRLLNLIFHPNFMSPLIWDVIVLNLYALASAIYLFILMLPALAGKSGWLAAKVADPHGFSEKWAKRIAPVALLFAIGIHVVTAWIFSTQGARDWWHTPVMAPDFVSVAIAVGTTVVLIAGALAYGTGNQYEEAYKSLGIIIFIATCVHIFLMTNDLVIHAWYGDAETHRLLDITWGNFAAAHIFEVTAPLFCAWLILRPFVRQSLPRLLSCCFLFIAGVFVHRFLIMPAAYNNMPLTITPFGLPHMHWSFPVAAGRLLPGLGTFNSQYTYIPSVIEAIILLGICSYAVFVILLAINKLPILEKAK